MLEQKEAILRLLHDDDPTTLRLVKSQLARAGATALAELRTLQATADPAAALHVRDVIAEIEEREADQLFDDFCRTFEDFGDLEDAAWQMARTIAPGDEFTDARELLDGWGAEVTRRLPKARTPLDRVETLVEYLGTEVRLRGNEEDYYNINNSLLPEVVLSREGIPISLSLVYMLVGRRAGLHIDGVGLPGHFIVRHREHFFDPFHGGRHIGLEECRALLERQNLVLTAQHLQPTPPRHMLVRMLANVYSLSEQSDPPLSAKIAEWIEALRRPRGEVA
jgi:regulator of sirC expression with transglutaminase-like and TPR domain